MRILHVISGMSPRAGGPSTVIRGLSGAQARRGHAITICTTNADFPKGLLDVPTHEPVFEKGVTTCFHALSFRPLYFSMALGRWLIRHMGDFDVVHIHGLYRFPPTFAAALARRRGIPHLIRPHGSLDPFLWRRSSASVLLKRLYERFFDIPNLNSAGAIQYSSDAEAEQARFLGLRAPSVIVPNGLDWADFAELPPRGAFRARLGVGAARPVVLFVGRINLTKGLDVLIPAFARVVQSVPGVVLAIVGPDNEGLGKEVRRWGRERGIQDRVRLLDHIEAQETRRAYVDADVFALPSYTENFGMTVVEAMACGCPVVISDRVKIWPLVEEAEAGIVVSLNERQISEALIRVLQDPRAGHRMGSAGRAFVQDRFDWGRIVEQLDQIYEALVRGEHPGSRQPGRVDI